MGFQREVAGVEQVVLTVGQVALERLGARGAEDLIVAPPRDQRRMPGALRIIAEQPPSKLLVMASTVQCMAT